MKYFNKLHTNEYKYKKKNLCNVYYKYKCKIHAMFDGYCLLGCDAMKSDRYVSMFQRDFLPPEDAGRRFP
jgi:hypothetical protein